MAGKKYFGICCFLAALLFVSAGVSATAGESSVSVTNHIRTGDIDIDLCQEAAEEIVTAAPGDVIPDKIWIENLAEDCFVRIRADFPENEAGFETFQLSEKDLKGISKEWVKRDAYYYYTKPVLSGEYIPFSEGVKFPEAWTEETAGQLTGFQVTAEAVQSVHFQPDFDSENPWGNLQAELCVHKNTGGRQKKEKSYGGLSVILEDGASRLTAVPDDFFSNLKTLMPGDEVSDQIEIVNHSGQKARLYFRTESPAELTGEQKELMKNLGLRIELDGSEIYSGPLDSTGLEKEILLGVFDTGKTGNLEFFISMPEEDQNCFAVRDTAVNWIFRCSLPEQTRPKTGDSSWQIFFYLLAAAGSAVTGIFCIRQINSRKRHKN